MGVKKLGCHSDAIPSELDSTLQYQIDVEAVADAADVVAKPQLRTPGGRRPLAVCLTGRSDLQFVWPDRR